MRIFNHVHKAIPTESETPQVLEPAFKMQADSAWQT